MNGIRVGTRGSCAAMVLAASVASAIPAGDPADVEAQQQFQLAMDAVVAEMMAPGPKVEEWDRGGVDLFRLVRMTPGGVRGNYLLTIDKDGERSVTIVDAEDIAAFVPEGWKMVLQAGNSARPQGKDNLNFAPVDGRYFMAGWDSQRRVGDAFCSTGKIGAFLYEDAASAAEGDIPPAMVPALFHAMAKRLQEHVICWRYDRQEGGYRIRYFLEDGRSLPVLDSFEEKVAVVPAADMRQLLNSSPAGQ